MQPNNNNYEINKIENKEKLTTSTFSFLILSMIGFVFFLYPSSKSESSSVVS